MPERSSSVRSTGSSRRSSGVSLRAALTLGPAMWAWMSTPPGHHHHPARVDPPGIGTDVGRPPCRPRCTRPGPLRRPRWPGRGPRPPVIRIAVTAPPRPAAASAAAAAVGASAGRGACRASGTPSSRCAVPSASTPAAAVRIDTSGTEPAGSAGNAAQRDLRDAGGQPRRRAVDAHRHVDVVGARERLRGAVRVPDGRWRDRRCRRSRSARPGHPAHRWSRRRRQPQRDHVTIVAERPRHLVDRERAALPAVAGGEPAPRARTRRAARRSMRSISVPQLRCRGRSAPAMRARPYQRVQGDQRVEVAIPRPRSLSLGALGGGGVPVVDDDQRRAPDAATRRTPRRRSQAVPAAAGGWSADPRAR